MKTHLKFYAMTSKMSMIFLQEGSSLGSEDTCKFDISTSKNNLAFIDISAREKNVTQHNANLNH